MKTVYASILLLSAGLVVSAACWAQAAPGYQKTPKCPSIGTKDIWKKNFDGCMKPFFENKESKSFRLKDAEAVCECAADGIVNSWTCEEMRRYENATRAEQDRLLAPIAATCSKRFVKSH